MVIDNFKCIDHLEILCSRMNLLVGTNSSGKSSILQAFLLLAQNISCSQGLSGDLVSLGSYDECKCVYSDKQGINISVENEEEEKVSICFYKREKGYLLAVSPEEVPPKLIRMCETEDRYLQYLSCHRIGPANAYRKNVSVTDAIGEDGRYAFSYLNTHSTDLLDQGMCKGTVDYTLLGQVNWWLKYIMDVEVRTEEMSGTDFIKVSYSPDGVLQIRPTNIGSGISYLCSVIITCLASPEEGIIVIENPEIHLHPKAQSKVCEFLHFISEHNRQLFVETHSDHIFNGFRAGIATGEIDQDEINILFVSMNDKHTSEIEKVKIGRLGRIDNQREDLFDQFDLDLNKMIGV